VVGVAEVGVGYAVVFANVAVLSCGVVVGVDFGREIDELLFGALKPWREEEPVIGVGVEWRLAVRSACDTSGLM